MIQTPATRDAPAFEAVYALVRENLDPDAGDIPVDRLLQVFRRLSDLYDTDVSSPLNMGYFCIDADSASIAAMDETNRRGANVVVRGQHPASAAFEQYAVDLIMEIFGLDPESGAGHFTACGTEANQTAMIVALTDLLSHRNPRCRAYDPALCTDEAGREEPYEYWRHGALPLTVRPALYVSPQTHFSIEKNARNLIGTASIRTVPVDGDLGMDVGALADAMARDAASGAFLPFMAVGSVGATPSGIVDPLAEIGAVCREHGAWFHVDAPWGAIAAFSPRLRETCLAGLDAADSLIFDPHKTLVPLGAGGCGMFLCRHREAVERAFNIYDRSVERHEFSSMSLQGSRANSGLRVLTSVLQPEALAQRIEGEAALGDTLRHLLREAGWETVNRTPLPVVCAVHPAMRAGAFTAADAVQHLRDEGVLAWAEALRPGEPEAVRLGIISRRTTEESLRFVVDRLAAFAAERG